MSATLEVAAPPAAGDLVAPPPIVPAAYLHFKRIPVRIAGVIVGIALIPVILLLMAAVRLTSPGPGLYRQRRVGLHGREFTIYKLRSMRKDAEDLSGPIWAGKNDKRVTPIGNFLRWSHLDELPQILNVIRGEMDFVGPRPERPEIIEELVGLIDNYNDRHEALPGITGVAQVNLPPDQELNCVRKKVAADRHYIENANLWFDLRLISATLLRIVGLRYHHGAKLLGVELPAGILNEAEGGSNPLPYGCDSQSANDTKVNLTAYDTFVIEEPVKSGKTAASPSRPPRVPR